MKKYAPTIRDAILLMGCALIAAGTAMLSVPAGLICAGVLMSALAVLDGFDGDNDENGGDGSQ